MSILWDVTDTDRLESAIDDALWPYNLDLHGMVLSRVTEAVVEHFKQIGVIE